MKKTILKFIKKFITTIVISMIFASIFSNIGLAADAETEGDCLNGYRDKSYIITIIEEAIFVDKNTKQEDCNDEQCILLCYRFYKKIDKTDENGNTVTTTEQDGSLVKTCDASKGNCDPVQVIISKKGGLSMLYWYIGFIYRWAAGFMGLIAVAVIIISSAQISLSGGEQDSITSAKNRIIKSISGLAVLFLSSLILYTINPTFFTL